MTQRGPPGPRFLCKRLCPAATSPYDRAMTRVMVIGNAAGGKSTMCGAVCAAHGLTYFAIDPIQWKPGWVPAPEAEFRAAHDAILARDRWLIDGYGPMEAVRARLEACDTVIFIDHPIHIHFWWAAKRQFKSLFWGRADGPEGCSMWRVSFRLFRMMWRLHKVHRPRLIAEIAQKAARRRVIHITSPAELNSFVRHPF